MQTLRLFIVIIISFFSLALTAQVDVSIEKNLLTSPPFQYGILLSYEIKVTNGGTVPITNIALRDIVPCGLTYIPSSQPWTLSGGNLTTTLTNTINPGQSFSTFIDFTLVSCLTPNAWVNRTEILSFTSTSGDALTDPNTTNNTDEVEADVYDLAMHKKLLTALPYAYGEVVTFRIKVFNQGNRTVNTVRIRDFVSALSGFTYDSSINLGWTGAAPTLIYNINSVILPGDSAHVDIKLKIVRTTGGVRSWLNYAEIQLAADINGDIIFDADSTPGSNSVSENTILPGSANDNNLLVRGPVFNEDEDDHDPANVAIFDLAMTKDQLTALSSFSYIQNVAYVFTVYNQGNTAATNIVVADYLSPALSYVATPLNISRGWTFNAGTQVATINFTEVLQPGQLDTFILDLKPNQFYVNPDMAWTDYGEILQADDTNPLTPNPIPDIDSSPDANQTNDAGGKPNSPSDNAIDGDGTGMHLDGVALTDEDDHDVHKIQIVDLALTNQVVGSTVREVGDQVVFAIKIINQGNVSLKNTRVVDSIGVGYGYTPGGVNAGWTGTFPTLTHTINPFIRPAHDTTIYLTLTVLPETDESTYINYAEVVIAQDSFNFNRNDDADGTFDSQLFNDNYAPPGSPDDNNVLGDANLGEDEDDHDVDGITNFCQKPTLTVGIPTCIPGDNTYSVTYYSSSPNISTTLGTIEATMITNITLGWGTTISAINDDGCETVLSIPALNTCPNTSNCTLPKLTVGQPICNGSTYTVSVMRDLGSLSTSAGTIVGNNVINIPLGANVTITATNGTCISNIVVTPPTDCDLPCSNPPITISGPVCDPTGSGNYSVNYTLLAGATIITNVGTVNNGTITNIPGFTNLVITVSLNGCETKTITVPAAQCVLCQKPTLTIGLPECNPLNNTYSLTFYSSSSNVTSTLGTMSGAKIINIPFGSPTTVTATTTSGCMTMLSSPGINACPPQFGCTLPKLTVGQPICNGNTYTVSFTNDLGVVVPSAGTVSANNIINIPIGTNINVTATNGSCVSRVNVLSPLGCSTPCINAPISISGPLCDASGENYRINYIINPGSTVTASEGILTANAVTNIPSGTQTTLTITAAGCDTKIVTIPPAVCVSGSGSISTYVWQDHNGDGQQAGSEMPIYGVTVLLFNTSNVMIDQTTTDVNGNAVFNGIAAGQYYMKYVASNDYTVTFQNQGNDNTDSDIDQSFGVGTTALFNVVTNQLTSNVDAGYYRCAQVGDLVWYDTNKNNLHDIYENGINGITVNIWRRQGSIWSIYGQTVTGHNPSTSSDDGWWKFCVAPGQYYVHFELPPIGLVAAQPNVGSDEEIDSDITNAFGYGSTASFTVFSGDMNCDLGGGFYPMAVLGNLVWLDSNGDGIQDQGEPKIQNVLIEAINPTTDEVLNTTTTDQNGLYNLEYLQQTNYYLRFTPPLGYVATLPSVSNDNNIDSDVNHSNGYNTTSTMALISGQINQGIDFGVLQAPLPVTWKTINVVKKDQSHLLSWSVYQEWNTSHYIVERSIDVENYITLGDPVKVGGSRIDDKSYTYSDIDVSQYGQYVYRVKAVDFDGSSSYSDLALLRESGEYSVDVYPNPTASIANITVNLPSDSHMQISLYDNKGSWVRDIMQEKQVNEGQHTYEWSMIGLRYGVYHVKVYCDNQTLVKKIIYIK
jgi:uncharacterized repeat protein (TIGR01451 family)